MPISLLLSLPVLHSAQSSMYTVCVFDFLQQSSLTFPPAFDDGRSHLLLCLHGLLPITYRSAQYNIPVALWITRDYPVHPPIVYVVPSPDLLVKPGPTVDPSGRCNLEYIQNWQRKCEVLSLNLCLSSLMSPAGM